MMHHIEAVEMMRAPFENSLELRIKYLTNDMSEDEFKFILQKNEKTREKTRDINNILTMLVHTGTDLLRQFVNKEITIENIKDVVTNLITYTNSALFTTGKRYTCVVPQINEITLDVYRTRSHGPVRNGNPDL